MNRASMIGTGQLPKFAEDMFKAMDRCIEKLERQIRKYRTRLEKRLKEGAFVEAPEYFT